MDEESNSGLVEVIYLLFLKDHSWPELLFLYIVIHLSLNSKFKLEEYFDIGENCIHDKKDGITLLLAKPFLVLLAMLFPIIFLLGYMFILTLIAKLILEELPSLLPTFNVGHMTINWESFKMLEFSIIKMMMEGSLLYFSTYIFCYSGARNKELAELKSKQAN